MSIKVINYDVETFTKQTTRGTTLTFKRVGHIMMVTHASVIAGLPAGYSVLFNGGQLGKSFLGAHTTTVLLANNSQYGVAEITFDSSGGIVIVNNSTAPSPIELRFSIMTMVV